jgi:hypothetical protein
MKPELVLPLAREWLSADWPLVLAAERILIRSGTAEDGPLAESALRTAWREQDWYRICGSLEILVTTRYWFAAPLVLEIDESAAYSYARRRTTRFLACSGIDEGITRLVDALWDCEDDTVLVGLEHAPRSARVTARRAELAASVWHDDDVRSAARPGARS